VGISKVDGHAVIIAISPDCESLATPGWRLTFSTADNLKKRSFQACSSLALLLCAAPHRGSYTSTYVGICLRRRTRTLLPFIVSDSC
jgi:hypothetical protein